MTEQPLRILQVNTWDIGGGAAKVAWNLFTAYRARGYDSWLAVGHKYSSDPDVLSIPSNRELYSAWSSFWSNIHTGLQSKTAGGTLFSLVRRITGALIEPRRTFAYLAGVEDFHYPGTRRLLTLPRQQPSIVHAHNLHADYFDLRALPWLSCRVPTILTMHDAWLLSGHCAHSFACDRWQTGCGCCPDLTIPPAIRRDATAANWQRKRAIYGRSRLYIATPSRWLMQKVEQSILAPAVVEARVIPNGVDLTAFQPADKRVVRATLGLPQEAQVLLFAAQAIRANKWKDYQTIRKAVTLVAERLQDRQILFIALGEDAPPEQVGLAKIHSIPYQPDSAVVARYYQAADAYIHAAHADTFPNAVLEALACGTPVVATAVGGIPEQVEEMQTGFLVPAGDVAGLATRLTQLLLDDSLRQQMGWTAAERTRQRFDLQRQVDTYLQWYWALTAGSSKL